jgi:hypothetical protein
MYRSQLLTIIFVGLALIVFVNADKEESQKEGKNLLEGLMKILSKGFYG